MNKLLTSRGGFHAVFSFVFGKPDKAALMWYVRWIIWGFFWSLSLQWTNTHVFLFRLITSIWMDFWGLNSSDFKDMFKVVCGTHTRYIIISAHAFLQQPIADLPSEYWRTLAFVVRDFVDHLLGGDSRLWASNGPRSNAARFVVPAMSRESIDG